MRLLGWQNPAGGARQMAVEAIVRGARLEETTAVYPGVSGPGGEVELGLHPSTFH